MRGVHVTPTVTGVPTCKIKNETKQKIFAILF